MRSLSDDELIGTIFTAVILVSAVVSILMWLILR